MHNISWSAIVQIVGTIGTVVGLILADQRAKRKSKQDAANHSDSFQVEMSKIATDAAKTQFENLKAQIADIQKEKDELERQYSQQIALKTEENKGLQEKVATLTAENQRLKNKVERLKQELEEK